MTEKKKILISWSGGKDSALAMYDIQQAREFQPIALITTINKDYNRISIHGIHRDILKQQAESLEIPLCEVNIPKNATNEIYESSMENTLQDFKDQGINEIMYGDIFLEDVREYRENLMTKMGMTGVYPLWGQDTKELANRFIGLGFKAIIAMVDSQLLDGKFAGRNYDHDFLNDIPEGIDPCGENGEFHTFFYDGPIFKKPIEFQQGKVVLRENRFYFCDFTSTKE